MSITGIGITISGEQSKIGRERISQAGLSDTLDCLQGDFCALPPGISNIDAAFAIESFIHAPNAESFFSEVGRVMLPGGLLIICDDFLGSREATAQRRASRWVRRFCDGWLAHNLATVTETQLIAAKYGFELEASTDLTPSIRLGLPRDIAIGVFVRTLGWLPWRSRYVAMLRGGDALQEGLRRGWLKYMFTVWRRTDRPPA